MMVPGLVMERADNEEQIAFGVVGGRQGRADRGWAHGVSREL